MSLRARNQIFAPRSVTDSLDGGLTDPGSMIEAINLIFDPSNRSTLTCRPAAEDQYDFSDFSQPVRITAMYNINNTCYGMVSVQGGLDKPFAYDLEAGALITISGTQDGSTLPSTFSTTGDWNPPSMSLMGIYLILTHPGFSGGGGPFFGWIDVTDPAAPVWNSGNTTGNALPQVPSAISQFNNRAWFAVGASIYYTDALTLNITNPTQALTCKSDSSVVSLNILPLNTQTQGILQSLAVFQNTSISLITGDDVFGSLSINNISDEIGTYSPRSIASTPLGLMFAANDGVRTVSNSGSLSEPNKDLKIPFVFAQDKTRASASYNNNIYRITVNNAYIVPSALQEYWFDFRQQGWTGPHTFTQSICYPYRDSFTCSFDTATTHHLHAVLFLSDVVQGPSSAFDELVYNSSFDRYDSTALSFNIQASPLPDGDGLYENSCIISVVDMQLPYNGFHYNFSAIDVDNGVLSNAEIIAPTNGSFWDAFKWGSGIWTAASYGMERYNIPWDGPLVFSKLVLQIMSDSSIYFKISKITMGIKPLNYVRKK